MKKVSKIDMLDERSEEVQEILGSAPKWPVRWGTTVVFILMLLMITISWIVRYPDIIEAKIIITTNNPPSRIIARTNGKIQGLRYKDNDWVAKDSIVGFIENPANIKDVIHLQKIIHAAHDKLPQVDPKNLPSLNLGGLQQDYNDFINAAVQYHFFTENDPLARQINALKTQTRQSRIVLEKLRQKNTLLKRQVELAQLDYDRDQRLFKQNVIAAKAMEEKEQVVLKSSEAFNDSELSLATSHLDLLKLENELETVEIQNREAATTLVQQVFKSFKNLEAAISTWEQTYLLRSPVSGKVSLYTFWSNGQFVNEKDEVMIIVSDEENIQLVGKVTMPILNSGKVKVGQSVNIYLDNYPFQEYGTLKGLVKKISLVPKKDAGYSIEVDLPDKLETTYHKQLEFRQELQGTAEIITEDLTLAQRIFYSFQKILKGKI